MDSLEDYFPDVGSIWCLPEGSRFGGRLQNGERLWMTDADLLLVCEIDIMATYFSGLFLRNGVPIEEVTGCVYKMLSESFLLVSMGDDQTKLAAVKMWNHWVKNHPQTDADLN